MGGACWLYSLFILNASLPLAIFIYENEAQEDSISAAARAYCRVALPSSMVTLLIFFLSMKKEYWGTFFSSERGKDLAKRRFLSSNEDSVKADAIFWNTRKYWEDIEDQIEKWVHENWERWMDEEPEWLDDSMKFRIPACMIPNVEDRKKVEVLQIEKRRSSLLGRLSAGSRLSFIGAKKVKPDVNILGSF